MNTRDGDHVSLAGDMPWFEHARAILCQTPGILESRLSGLPVEWLSCDAGPDTWSPWQVLAHVTDLEECDWIVRVRQIVREGDQRPFKPIDREAGFDLFAGWEVDRLLERFRSLRSANLADAEALIRTVSLERQGLHPAFGVVTLRQLVAAWAVHDLDHIGQIAKTMAVQYREAIGPWRAYLPVVDAE